MTKNLIISGIICSKIFAKHLRNVDINRAATAMSVFDVVPLHRGWTLRNPDAGRCDSERRATACFIGVLWTSADFDAQR